MKYTGMIGAWLTMGTLTASPPPPATARVQIVNATCVPAIALQVNGTDTYPVFPQGQQTADGPTDSIQSKYQATDLASGEICASKTFHHSTKTGQTVVILGDFTTPSQPAQQTARRSSSANDTRNATFLHLSHASAGKPIRLRVINGIPERTLVFSDAEGNPWSVPPLQMRTLSGQPATYEYAFTMDGHKIPVFIRQDTTPRNAMIIFFLKEGKPAFMRVFENP